MQLMIISGRSGAGKSVALSTFEDMGFYCVDNIPIVLLPELANTLKTQARPLAVSIDIRNINDSKQNLLQILEHIPSDFDVQIIFLDADKNTLIRRYSETRRTHPLASKQKTLEEAIDDESAILDSILAKADLVINTDKLSIYELSDTLRFRILGKKERDLTIILESFGFKHGLPTESDFVFDVRFLPNPHWDPSLKSLTGLDTPVKEFLNKHWEVNNFIYQTANYLQQWISSFKHNNRSYLTISIGCTGGQHRSVYVVERLAEIFEFRHQHIQVRHKTLLKKIN